MSRDQRSLKKPRSKETNPREEHEGGWEHVQIKSAMVKGSPIPFWCRTVAAAKSTAAVARIFRKGSLYLLQNGASDVKDGLHGRWGSEMMRMLQQFTCCAASVSSSVSNLTWLLLSPPPSFFLPCVGVWADINMANARVFEDLKSTLMKYVALLFSTLSFGCTHVVGKPWHITHSHNATGCVSMHAV